MVNIIEIINNSKKMEKHEDGWDELSETSEEASHLVSLYK
jgi:hypothetical protein